MKKNIITLFLLLVAQWLSAIGHFEYIIKDDGVYCGSYGESRKIEEADPETFEIVGRENSP